MCLSAVKLDHSGELFWDTPSWLSAWVSVFWAWRMDLNKGVPTLFAYCEKLIRKIFFKFKQGTCPWMAFAWNFFGILKIFFLGGSVGQIIYREYKQYFGAQIFPVVWPVLRDRFSKPEMVALRVCSAYVWQVRIQTYIVYSQIGVRRILPVPSSDHLRLETGYCTLCTEWIGPRAKNYHGPYRQKWIQN